MFNPSTPWKSSLLLGLGLCATLAAEDYPYIVTDPSGFSGGSHHGRHVYENRAEGSFDPEQMPEIRPGESRRPPPEPVVIMYSEPAPVAEIYPEFSPPPAPLRGEAAVYAEILEDLRLQQCLFIGDDLRCDPETGFQGGLGVEVLQGGEQVPSDVVLPVSERRLEARPEPSVEERFEQLEDSFFPDFDRLFD